MPAWMGAIDAFGPVKAAGAGVALSAVNPKNLLFVVAAAATEAQAGLSTAHQAIVWIVFTLLSTIGVAVPVVLYLALGERAPALLERIKVWLIRNQAAVLVGALPRHRRDADRSSDRRLLVLVSC